MGHCSFKIVLASLTLALVVATAVNGKGHTPTDQLRTILDDDDALLLIADIMISAMEKDPQTAKRFFKAIESSVVGELHNHEGGWRNCSWMPVGHDKAHFFDEEQWCWDGKFIIQIDLDSGGTDAASPFVGRVACCSIPYTSERD